MGGVDHYASLGLERNASVDEIKQAYRKLARKFHPDVNPGDHTAEERFKQISAAFEVLGDPEKRALYDEFGDDGLRAGFDAEKARSYRDWQRRAQATDAFRAGSPDSADAWRSGSFNLSDLFDHAGGFKGAAADQRGADLHTDMSISFRDAVLGSERELHFSRPIRCASCAGTGRTATETPQTCHSCAGSGQQSVAQGPLAFRVTCTACHGSGKQPGPPCDHCRGAGRTEQSARLMVRVPAGVDDRQSIRLAGQGLSGTGAGTKGDLLIRIKVTPHPLLRRQGRDLYLDVPITVREAMLGATIRVPTLTGTINLTVPAGVQSGTKLRAKERGVPAAAGRPAGDLYVVVRVHIPSAKRDPEAATRAADELEHLYDGNVRDGLRL